MFDKTKPEKQASKKKNCFSPAHPKILSIQTYLLLWKGTKNAKKQSFLFKSKSQHMHFHMLYFLVIDYLLAGWWWQKSLTFKQTFIKFVLAVSEETFFLKWWGWMPSNGISSQGPLSYTKNTVKLQNCNFAIINI